jgi:hypothetical protein
MKSNKLAKINFPYAPPLVDPIYCTHVEEDSYSETG